MRNRSSEPPISAVPITGQKRRDVALPHQSTNRHVRPMRNSQRLNARAVDPVEVPDEGEHLGKTPYSVRFAGLECPDDDSPTAEQLGTLQPNHQRSPWQPQIECRDRKVAVADPVIPRMCFLDQISKGTDITFCPMWLPDVVQTDHTRARSFAKLPRQSRLSGAGAA